MGVEFHLCLCLCLCLYRLLLCHHHGLDYRQDVVVVVAVMVAAAVIVVDNGEMEMSDFRRQPPGTDNGSNDHARNRAIAPIRVLADRLPSSFRAFRV